MAISDSSPFRLFENYCSADDSLFVHSALWVLGLSGDFRDLSTPEQRKVLSLAAYLKQHRSCSKTLEA